MKIAMEKTVAFRKFRGGLKFDFREAEKLRSIEEITWQNLIK